MITANRFIEVAGMHWTVADGVYYHRRPWTWDGWSRALNVPDFVIDSLCEIEAQVMFRVQKEAMTLGGVWSYNEAYDAKAHGSALYEQLAQDCEQVRELQAAEREAAAIEETRLANGHALGYCRDSDMEGQANRDREALNEVYDQWRASWTHPLPGEGVGDWAARNNISPPGCYASPESRACWATMVELAMRETENR